MHMHSSHTSLCSVAAAISYNSVTVDVQDESDTTCISTILQSYLIGQQYAIIIIITTIIRMFMLGAIMS